jgi:signal transduction histidine kinase/DNA-binding response OmpR family regulator
MIVLFIVAGISVWLTIALLNDLNMVSEQVRMLDALGDANSELAQAATAARLYALERSEEHFTEWETELAEARQSVARLLVLSADDPQQYARAASIEQMLKDKSGRTARVSTRQELDKVWGYEANGVSAMRPIMDRLLAMGDAERQMLIVRNENARAGARAARWAIGLSSALAVVLVCSAAMVILRDLANRHRAAEELERAKLAAEAASLAKSAFLANMSHELRTPLTSIMGYADLLLTTNRALPSHPHGDPVKREEYLQTLRRSGEHLLTLINDILDVSKIEAGRMTIENVDCRLVDVLADVESMISPRAREKSVAFSIEYQTSIPDRFQTDPTRFRQILMNLVGNAVKFTDRGSVRLAVRFEPDAARPAFPSPPASSPACAAAASAPAGAAQSMAGRLIVLVIDTGVGISADEQTTLFQPFVQADVSTTRRFGGTGLGLSISRRLARMLGGDITVQSQVGRGSTFRLELPADPVGGALLQPTEAGRTVAGISRILGESPRSLGLHVLLAEDGEENREVIALHLQHAGCEVVTAPNGQEAHRLATEAKAAGEPYDVILMDMQMPVMDGYTATSKLRAEGYQGVVIALTAHAMPEDRERCLRVGCDEYAAKPVDIPALLLLMERLCGHRGTAQSPDAPAVAGWMMDDPALRLLTQKFCSGTEKTVSNLRELGARQAWPELAAAAHKLAGTAGAYGFHEITRAAKGLEQVLREGPTEAGVGQQIDQIALTCAVAREKTLPAAEKPPA